MNEVDTLKQENARLRAALCNWRGDDLCWIESEPEALALPEAEFMESCRRYRKQLAGERGEAVGCMTIAQLETRIVELDAVNADLRAQLREARGATE